MSDSLVNTLQQGANSDAMLLAQLVTAVNNLAAAMGQAASAGGVLYQEVQALKVQVSAIAAKVNGP